MSSWVEEIVTSTCPDCGADTSMWCVDAPQLDYLDADDQAVSVLAFALIAHRHEQHRVSPEVGDLVTYSMPWNAKILTSSVYRVDGIRRDVDFREFARKMRGNDDLPPLMVDTYGLLNPHRRSDGATISIGLPDSPYVFTIVSEAPPEETDLFDLLGWDMDEEAA